MTSVTQIAYSTRDIEKTARSFAEIDGIGPFYMAEFPLYDTTYQGKPIDYERLKVAFGYRGHQQIELLQVPEGMHSVYSEGLEGRHEVFHHTYNYLDTAEENYDAIIARHQAAGEHATYQGLAGDGRIRFAYIDARKRLGHFIELLDTRQMAGTPADLGWLYERMEAEARQWDGKRPIRSIEELL